MRNSKALLILVGLYTSLAHIELVAQSLHVSPTSGPPTTKVKLTGSGFTPNVPINIFFDGRVIGSGQTDSTGAITTNALVQTWATMGDHAFMISDSVSLSAVSSFVVQISWPQGHWSAAQTGFNPYEYTLNVAKVPSLSVAWKNPGVNPIKGPVTDGFKLYVTDNSSLSAYDALSGTKLWSFPAASCCAYGPPAVAGGLVFFSDDNNGSNLPAHVYAVNANSGALKWTFTTPSPGGFGGVTVVGSTVYAAQYANQTPSDTTLYALKAGTGALVWTVTLQIGQSRWAPTVFNGSVFVGGDSGVVALTASTGAILWSQTQYFAVSGISVANNSTLCFGGGITKGFPFYVVAINATNGAPVWVHSLGGNYLGRAPAVLNGWVNAIVYVTDQNSVLALDAFSGLTLWTSGNSAVGWSYSSPAVANGVVYVASDTLNRLLAFDAFTGSQIWTFISPFGGTPTQPIVAAATVYCGFLGDGLYAFR